MTRGSNQFHTAPGSLMIGLGANESGKEGVVNVDDAARKTSHELIAQNLHVAGQDNQTDPARLQFPDFGGFLFRLVLDVTGKQQKSIPKSFAISRVSG